MGKHAEDLNNAELLAKAREVDLISMAARQSVRIVECRSHDEDFDHIADGFAALCDNEDFKTSWETFFPTPEYKREFLGLDNLAQVVIRVNAGRKRALRPLPDFFNKLR